MNALRDFVFGGAAAGNNNNNDDDDDEEEEEEEEEEVVVINQNQQVADSIRSNKIVSTTRRGYRSKMKTMGMWLVTTYPDDG